jgi:exodeoxyribonuclease X
MADLFCVLDTETSGLDPADGAKLLELSVARIDDAVILSGTQPKPLSWFVEHTGRIPSAAKAVHHITEEMVAPGSPGVWPRPDLIEALNALSTDSAIMVAHNANFDRRFLPELEGSRWLCTYRCALHLYPELGSFSLQALRYELGVEPPAALLEGLAPHRAAFDVACTCALLIHMLKTHSAEELLELSNTPAILHRCRFGKYRGQLWSEVPRDYCQWLIRQHGGGNSFDEDVVATARYWLNGGVR